MPYQDVTSSFSTLLQQDQLSQYRKVALWLARGLEPHSLQQQKIHYLRFGEAEGLTRGCIKKALDGDMTALRLCLERILPPSRERPVKINLPATSTANGINHTAEAILQGVATGELLPADGTAHSNIIEKRRAAFETLEIEKRLAVLEEEYLKNGRKEGKRLG